MPVTRHRDATAPIRATVTGSIKTDQSRIRLAYAGGWLAPVIALVATYAVFWLYRPYPHSSLGQFLAMFARNNTSAWPMQLVWYAAALAMVGLALSPTRRATLLICLLAAANLGWIGLGYFAWLNPGMSFSAAWATVFVVEAVLFVVAGVVRDVVIRPRRDVSSLLGATFIAFALVVYPVAGLLSGHGLHALPLFGLSPCATVTFYFGLLLWAEPPVQKYLLILPLAWAFRVRVTPLGFGAPPGRFAPA